MASMRHTLFRGVNGIILSLLVSFNVFSADHPEHNPEIRFEITYPASVHAGPITGRAYVMITRKADREPRFTFGRSGDPIFGVDFENFQPGETVIIDNSILGSPIDSLSGLPAAEYYVQAFINVYTEFRRSDGHVLWFHNDQWEGQHFNRSPGNLYSDAAFIRLDAAQGYTVRLETKNIIPPIEIPPDTEWVKRFRFKSDLLSEFWGQPIYLGATVLLPEGYAKNRKLDYPVVYMQGHFSLRPPYGFRTEPPEDENRRAQRGYEFYKAWIRKDAPRFIYVTFQHPCPYFDDSYAVNSANCGPYGDAIMDELIPEVERRFRIIQEPYARLLEGGSTGGWESLALQIFYPDFFGGCFSYCPDPIDFRDVQSINIYNDTNVYNRNFPWRTAPIAYSRRTDGSIILTSEQVNKYEHVLGTKGRSAEQWDIWQAVYGPVGEDGYTKPLYDRETGDIDPDVAEYWKQHYDLKHYLETNWSNVGKKLKGKLYIFTGDMDTFYLNNAVHLFENFLKSTQNPHVPGTFLYGPRKGHCWTGAFTPFERLKYFADHIVRGMPEGVGVPWWKR